jgi:hypothetical protein
MSDLLSLSADLTDDEWLAEIDTHGEERGYFEPVGPDHAALFLDESLDVLLVSFDSIASARAGSASGLPHAMLIAEERGWSHLSILSKTTGWFRDSSVYGYFDRLVDDGFFEDFDHVLFYGVGPAGYAACAYSVTAPGATVIAVAPQATLDPRIASWDDRFTRARSRDFSSRYGYAPDMLEAAQAAYILHDPTVDLDAMHAALYRGEPNHSIRLRHTGPRIGTELQDMRILGPLFDAAVDGTLTPLSFYKAFRKRRDYPPYLRALLNRVHVEGRHFLTALLCRAVLARKSLPQFESQLKVSEHRLRASGRSLPPSLAERRGATEPERA